MIQSIPSAASSAPGGAVGGASNLTTAGAIPYVVSAGTLGQDAAALFWDATNDRLGVGTNAPATTLHVIGIATIQDASGERIQIVKNNTAEGYIGTVSSDDFRFVTNNSFRGSVNGSTGNLLWGGSSFTDGNFKLDIQSSGSSGTGRRWDQTAVVGTTLDVVRAGVAQSGNLSSWQLNAGTEIAYVSSSGDIFGQGILAANAGRLGSLSRGYFAYPSDGALNMVNASGTQLIAFGNDNNGAVITTVTRTITGAVTDGYTAGVSLMPTYTAATAQTVTRHNYINLANPVLSGAGPAALTDAAVFRFDAAAGTHKAVDAGTTKITVGAVDAWLKINVNGTLYYVPAYTSKTT